MTDLDDLIARLREATGDKAFLSARTIVACHEAAAALASLRDEVARKEEAAYREGLDKGYDDGYGAPAYPPQAEEYWQNSKARAALADQNPPNAPDAGSWEDGDTVWNVRTNTVTHRFEGGRWVSQE